MTEKMRLDYESRSRTNLITEGLAKYVADPSTGILMAAWENNDDGEVDFWDITQSKKPPKHFVDRLRDPKVLKWAFNAQFERRMTEEILGIKVDPHSWRCTMVLAYMMGFSGSLAQVGTALGFDEDKLKDPLGKKLIGMFSSPRKPTKKEPYEWRDAATHPEEFHQFGMYCRQDVRSESAIGRRLSRYPILESEWDVYYLDQYINDTGLTIDTKFARAALDCAERYKPRLIEEMKDITGLDNPNSTAQILPWLNDRGYVFGDMRSETVSQAIREAEKLGLEEDTVRVLQLRQHTNKSSLGKYETMLNGSVNKKFYYTLQMHGAGRTGRWAGRKLQTHNFTRTPKMLEAEVDQEIVKDLILRRDLEALELYVGQPMDALAGMIRAAIIPEEGKKFVVCDLASIESVVIGWLTDCKWFMDTLGAGRDLYRSFAAEWLNLPYEDTKPHRSKAKPATLGAGYGLGGGKYDPKTRKKSGLWAYGENMGVFMTQKEAQASVDAFRKLCPEIVGYWRELEDAARFVIKNGSKSAKGVVVTKKCGKVTFEYRKPFMVIVLPSGRRLYYFKPFLKSKKVEYVDKKTGELKTFDSQQIHYYGNIEGGKWGLQYTHGGKLVENIVQAIARDVLLEGLKKAHNHGFKIPFHVHDEIITEVDIDDEERNIELLKSLMVAKIQWAPGLPLGAAGWEGFFYRKD